MYAQLATLAPLPTALQSPAGTSLRHPSRRHHMGDFLIEAEALAHFNQLLVRLRHFPLDPDQLATASRELAGHAAPACPTSIQQRLQLAGAVEQMLADATWRPAGEVVAPARVVVDYVHGQHALIPGSLPPVRQLDDAILVMPPGRTWPARWTATSTFAACARSKRSCAAARSASSASTAPTGCRPAAPKPG